MLNYILVGPGPGAIYAQRAVVIGAVQQYSSAALPRGHGFVRLPHVALLRAEHVECILAL